jgi:hypothetical protein
MSAMPGMFGTADENKPSVRGETRREMGHETMMGMGMGDGDGAMAMNDGTAMSNATMMMRAPRYEASITASGIGKRGCSRIAGRSRCAGPRNARKTPTACRAASSWRTRW